MCNSRFSPVVFASFEMIRTVVLEENPPAGEHLARLLADFCPLEIVGTATGGPAGLKLCLASRPDAVFLDVNLSDENDSPLATQLSSFPKPPLLVFTASSSERAADAFRLEAVDFLMKPIDRLQLSETVKRLLTLVRPIEFGASGGSPIPTILPINTSNLSDAAHSLLPVTDLDHDQIRLLARHEIVAVLRRKRRTWIHTVLEEFPTYYPLAQLARWLEAESFIQVSRDALVNLRAVQEIRRHGGRLYCLRLHDRAGTEIIASRSGSTRLAAALKISPPRVVTLNVEKSGPRLKISG
jgi:two-component system, LytTR family, response regulator LytT